MELEVDPGTALLLREAAKYLGPHFEPVVEAALFPIKARVSHWHLENYIRACKKTQEILDREGVPRERLSPRMREAAPIFEAAGQEDDESLQDMWAHLLARALNPDTSDLGVDFHAVLVQLSPREVAALRVISERVPNRAEEGASLAKVARELSLNPTSGSFAAIVKHLKAIGLIAGDLGSVDEYEPDALVAESSRHGLFLSPLGRALLDACESPT